MTLAADFWSFIEQDLDDLAQRLRPIKAYVGDEDAEGRVTLRFPGQEAATAQRYPKLAGPPLAPGDPVYVLRRGDKHLVLGKISDGTWSGGNGGDHDHDDRYAPLDHHHDDRYAPLDHDHDGIYSPVGHHHDDAYAALDHGHGVEDISGLVAHIRDVIADTLMAGQNVTINVDPTSGAVTINAAGGGGDAFDDLFPINAAIRPDQGNYNTRLGPSTNHAVLGTAAPNTPVHDTGIRAAGSGYTWAYCWFDNLNFGWVIVDAFG